MQTQKRKITIVTRLYKGVSDENAGIPIVVWEWHQAEPHNLIDTVETLKTERLDNERSWGNIGCGHSWFEIDGIAISDIQLHAVPYRIRHERPPVFNQELSVADARAILNNPAEYAVLRP